MKKIRLITGLSALSTLGVSTLPLTSCKKQPIEQFTVHFETNGGSAIADVKVNKGQKVTKPADPTKDGYIFKGWYSDPNLTKQYNFDSLVESNLVIYAGWKGAGTGQVAKQQWEDAFTNLVDTDNANFTYDGLRLKCDGGVVSLLSAQTLTVQRGKLIVSNRVGSNYFQKHNNCYYFVRDYYTTNVCGPNLLSQPYTPLPIPSWFIVSGCYDYVVYDSELSAYRYEYKISETQTFVFIVWFNPDYQIDSMTKITYIDENNYSVENSSFHDYGTTEVTMPYDEETIDWTQTTLVDVDKNNKYKNSEPAASGKKEDLFNVNFAVTSDFTPTTITLLNEDEEVLSGPEVIGDCKIYVNGTERSCAITKDLDKAILKITGLDLKTSDQVQIVWGTSLFRSPWWSKDLSYVLVQ